MSSHYAVEETVNKGFQSSLEHVFSELKRIELKLLLGFKRLRQGNNNPGEESPLSYYISEKEVNSIIGSLLQAPFKDSDKQPELDTITRSLRELEFDIARKKQESQRCGLNLRLCELERLFSLSDLDIDIILTCLLPELNPNYERFYAYLQDDITQKRPTVNMILRLLYVQFEGILETRQAFYLDAPLVKNHLLHIYDGRTQSNIPLLAKAVQIDERISDYLLGSSQIDRRLQSWAKIRQPAVRMQDLILPEALKDRLARLVTCSEGSALIYQFYGTDGVGKQTTAEAVCNELGMPLLNVEVSRMLAADTPAELSVPLIFREGRLQAAALYLNKSDLLLSSESSDSDKVAYTNIINELENYPYLVFLSSDSRLELKEYPHGKPVVNIEFSPPSYAVRKQLWQRQLHEGIRIASDVYLDDLANKFRLNSSQIYNAVSMARSLALWRDPENGLITSNDLYVVCRQQSGQGLNTLSHRTIPQYNWDDIILPKDQREQLIEICNRVKYRHIVCDDWGFGLKLARGKGLNVLFAGPSGTGKTMAAEIMGNELGIDLYKIDLSAIVSKYIGETEKNLERIFREGHTANAIIFFDEADAMFGKRSEVRDSHDRYANIEISYLLQRMEDYDGMIILATNLRKNLDEAFVRRMHFAVEFPFPEEADRLRIWQSIFPRRAPLAQDVDLSFLARQFQITGGNIRNIALAAAFLAAQDSGLITMESIIRATKREYQKMGKLCTESDFAHYFELVKG